MLTTEERIKILIPARGYIVLGSMEKHEIGEKIDLISGYLGGKLSQPFVVIKETNKQDAVEQQEILGIQKEEPAQNWPHFYRLSTD